MQIKGTFKSDKLHGKGVIFLLDGRVIEGVFKEGAAVGEIVITNVYGEKNCF